jgi:hypothetical protein
MAKYKIFGTTSKELTLPTTKPETSLDFVNSQCIDPSYTFTRNSSGTYVGDDGLIKTAAVNEPRFDYDPATGESLGLLVEEARTNLALSSEDFSNTSYWNPTGQTITTNAVVAPDGNTTADNIVPSSGTNVARYLYYAANPYSMSASTIYTTSIFVKKNGLRYFAFQVHDNLSGYHTSGFDLDTGTVVASTVSNIGTAAAATATIVSYPNGWYRCIITGITASTGTTGRTAFSFSSALNANASLGVITADGVNGGYVWGHQVEQGSFPTSYIPTTGSAVTRQPDQLVLNRTLNPQGAFYIESNTLGTSLVADNGSSTISPPQGTKSALFYNTSRTLSMSSSTQPVEGNYDVPQNLNRVSLGFDRLNNSNYINGHLKKFMYYGSPVTEDNLRSLTGNTRSTFRFDIEQIITDGLVLNLDAGNPASYPGSGTTWSDLSGNGNNGTLVNGVGYNSGNGGSIVFDGTNDYAISTQNFIFSSNNPLTISVWIKTNSLTLDGAYYRRILSFNTNYGISTTTTSVGWYTAGVDLITPVTISTGLWYKVDCIYTGTQYQTYLNGVLANSFTSTFPATSSQLWIGRFHSSNDGRFNGNIAQASIYNRALSASEVSQNFNATRSRFGI